MNKPAVVILSYNSWSWHKKFLPGIIAYAEDAYEVVVVDHASTDPLAPYFQKYFPDVQLLTLKTNTGFAGGYHRALLQIKAPYYVLLSADFEVTPNWFQPLHAFMEANPKVAACAPKIKSYHKKTHFEYAGAAGGFIDPMGFLFCRGRIFDTVEKDDGQYNDNIPVLWASGGCLMVRSDVYHEIGGLDTQLFAHMEEVDLCWRIWNQGHQVYAIGSSEVYHVGGSIISYGSPQKTFYNFRNNLILLLKNRPTKFLIPYLFARLCLDGLAGIQFLLKGQFKNCWAIARAHFSFYSKASYYYKWRKQNPPKSFSEGHYHKSILWQYFVKGKKTYQSLPETP